MIPLSGFQQFLLLYETKIQFFSVFLVFNFYKYVCFLSFF